MLFLITISDIMTSVVTSFADDTRVSEKIKSTDDTKVLQQDLTKIYAWAENFVKDFGMFMSNDFNFGRHIDKTCAEAKKYCSWTLRTFSARDKTTLLTLWKSIVQSRTDYCSQLWSPYKITEI